MFLKFILHERHSMLSIASITSGILILQIIFACESWYYHFTSRVANISAGEWHYKSIIYLMTTGFRFFVTISTIRFEFQSVIFTSRNLRHQRLTYDRIGFDRIGFSYFNIFWCAFIIHSFFEFFFFIKKSRILESCGRVKRKEECAIPVHSNSCTREKKINNSHR